MTEPHNGNTPVVTVQVKENPAGHRELKTIVRVHDPKPCAFLVKFS